MLWKEKWNCKLNVVVLILCITIIGSCPFQNIVAASSTKSEISNIDNGDWNYTLEEDPCEITDIESPDDFSTYEGEDYTIGYPDKLFLSGSADDEQAYFWNHANQVQYLFEENPYSSIKEAYDDLYDDAHSWYDVDYMIVDKPKEGRMVLAGKCEGYHGWTCNVYYLANITKNHIYSMEIYYPIPSDKDEALHQAYYVDCMYRLCSFNGSPNEEKHTPRKYDDFVESEEYDLEQIMYDPEDN